jgi:putative spermidine/putrescine transport system permease protein
MPARHTRTWRWLGWVLPLGVAYTLLYVVPQGVFLRVSLLTPRGPADAGGPTTLDNYADVVGDEYFRSTIIDTLSLSALTGAIAVLIAYPVAFRIARRRDLMSTVLFVTIVASMIMSHVVRALGWRSALSAGGPINRVLAAVGVIDEPLPLVPGYSGVVIGMVHTVLPLAVLSLIPVVDSVPRILPLAARGLGASSFRSFRTVIFPLTRHGVVAAFLLVFAAGIAAFTMPVLLGGGQVGVLGVVIRQQLLQVLNYPVGAALSVVQIGFVFLVVVAGLLFGTRTLRAGTGTAAAGGRSEQKEMA